MNSSARSHLLRMPDGDLFRSSFQEVGRQGRPALANPKSGPSGFAPGNGRFQTRTICQTDSGGPKRIRPDRPRTSKSGLFGGGNTKSLACICIQRYPDHRPLPRTWPLSLPLSPRGGFRTTTRAHPEGTTTSLDPNLCRPMCARRQAGEKCALRGVLGNFRFPHRLQIPRSLARVFPPEPSRPPHRDNHERPMSAPQGFPTSTQERKVGISLIGHVTSSPPQSSATVHLARASPVAMFRSLTM